MKNKNLFKAGIVFSLSTLLAFGVATGLSMKSKPVDEAKAADTDDATTETYSGNVVVQMKGTTCWSTSSAKLAVYFFNGDKNGWSTNVKAIGTSTSETKYFLFNYSLKFEPKNMIVTRHNSNATTPSWDNKWNQTCNLDFAPCVWLNDTWGSGKDESGNACFTSSDCGTWTPIADVYSSTSSKTWAKKVSLSSLDLGSDDHPELSGKVTLEKEEAFKIKYGSGESEYSNSFSTEYILTDYFKVEGTDDNIVCKEAGEYTFYFDTDCKKLWITNDVLVEADGWAQYFNNNAGCKSNGSELPSGWSNCATEYGKLDDKVKDYIYAYEVTTSNTNLDRALHNYDHAISYRDEQTLSRFIVNSSGTARGTTNSRISIGSLASNSNSSTNAIIVIIISLVTITTLGSVIYLKTRKHS